MDDIQVGFKLNGIVYKSGFKYQLVEPYSVAVGIFPMHAIVTDFIRLHADGTLTVEKGYAWDGPSGPTFDTPSFMRGSLVHDALYQLMRENLISIYEYRLHADELLRRMCREDGMWMLRAWYVYMGVRLGGESALMQIDSGGVLRAP
jgi:hypothetical protein